LRGGVEAGKVGKALLFSSIKIAKLSPATFLQDFESQLQFTSFHFPDKPGLVGVKQLGHFPRFL
ncbi:hypothetical protein, partial [Hymenobacter persicinus]|uniref:hypothetical protein n=1 Tax=Hymenobacter persicinus TaxID=2025506 RepID=UPI001A92F284